MGRKVLLGVSGGIAAYKAAEIVRALVKQGDEVRVIMTKSAQEFVTPLTLQVLSGERVGTSTFDPSYESEIGHIELARWADVVLVAPASANVVARLAHGLADDLLTTVLLATTAPVVVAPAMNTQMYHNPLVQRNLEQLERLPHYHVIPPDSGELACKEVGAGRLPDVDVLLEALERALCTQILAGKQVLISAGPTRELIDPARFLSNPSSGKMGYALARLAQRMGARVVLVSGPTSLTAPKDVDFVPVMTAVQMHDAIMAQPLHEFDFIVMAAAVADWRPETTSIQKREKASIDSRIELAANPDILMELGACFGPGTGNADSQGPTLVGFAAETHDIEQRGRAKLRRKNAHFLVANKVGGEHSAFGADTSSICVIDEGNTVSYGPASKEELAAKIWQHAVHFRQMS